MTDQINPEIQGRAIDFAGDRAKSQWLRNQREQYLSQWKLKGAEAIRSELDRLRKIMERDHDNRGFVDGEQEAWKFAALNGLLEQFVS